MNPPEEFHYHCLIDPSDGAIISQGETAMNGRSPLKIGDDLIERWGIEQLPSMENHEKRTLDYFYATSLIRRLVRTGRINAEGRDWIRRA